MTITTIHHRISQDYSLHSSIRHIERTGDVNLKITSRLASAKDPNAERTVVNLTLPRAEMHKLGRAIVAATQED